MRKPSAVHQSGGCYGVSGNEVCATAPVPKPFHFKHYIGCITMAKEQKGNKETKKQKKESDGTKKQKKDPKRHDGL